MPVDVSALTGSRSEVADRVIAAMAGPDARLREDQSTAVAALWIHPDWRPAVAVALAATGAVLLAVTLLPSTPSVRRGRLGDVAESIALLSLLPLLVVAVGVFSAIRG